MRLTDIAVRKANARDKLYKLSDGQGLQVWVYPDGVKRWRQAYRLNGAQRVLAIGVYPRVGLKEAREARDGAKLVLADGVDPMHAKRVAQSSAHENTFTFVAEQLVAKKRREAKSPATLTKLEWLIDLARTDIGSRPISQMHRA